MTTKNKQKNKETQLKKRDKKNLSYFDRDLLWWQQCTQYGNTKIPRFKLTPYKLFPLTNMHRKRRTGPKTNRRSYLMTIIYVM